MISRHHCIIARLHGLFYFNPLYPRHLMILLPNIFRHNLLLPNPFPRSLIDNLLLCSLLRNPILCSPLLHSLIRNPVLYNRLPTLFLSKANILPNSIPQPTPQPRPLQPTSSPSLPPLHSSSHDSMNEHNYPNTSNTHGGATIPTTKSINTLGRIELQLVETKDNTFSMHPSSELSKSITASFHKRLADFWPTFGRIHQIIRIFFSRIFWVRCMVMMLIQ